VVEFALVSVLLVLLLFAVLQVGVYFYARNIVAASAADAARYAATARTNDGSARAEQLIADGLGATQADAIRCTATGGTDGASGLAVSTVRCVGHVRALLVSLDLPLKLDLASSALQEQAP
jgi:Flp pilus assembly protein TadG